jgi:hypothetical protein
LNIVKNCSGCSIFSCKALPFYVWNKTIKIFSFIKDSLGLWKFNFQSGFWMVKKRWPAIGLPDKNCVWKMTIWLPDGLVFRCPLYLCCLKQKSLHNSTYVILCKTSSVSQHCGRVLQVSITTMVMLDRFLYSDVVVRLSKNHW